MDIAAFLNLFLDNYNAYLLYDGISSRSLRIASQIFLDIILLDFKLGSFFGFDNKL